MKTVAKAILHQNKKALLQFRDDKESIPLPATWSLFGGEIEEGETPKSCIQREIKEEIGFAPTNVKLIDKQVRTEGDEKCEIIFLARSYQQTSINYVCKRAKLFLI